MPMAPTATRAPPRLLSKNSWFLAPSPNAAATVRLGRRAGMDRAVVLGVAPRDGEWGADPNASSGSGRMVDEDMATLRRRIREARAAALSEEDDTDTDSDADDVGVPAGWTELERRHHGGYAAGVRGVVCLLEALLVNTRPGLGAVVVALLLLGVPASVVFLLCAKLIQAVDTISSAVIGR